MKDPRQFTLGELEAIALAEKDFTLATHVRNSLYWLDSYRTILAGYQVQAERREILAPKEATKRERVERRQAEKPNFRMPLE